MTIYKNNALEYFKKGYTVIPDKQGSKAPAILGWNDYANKKPNLDEVNQWCEISNTNISVLLGSCSGIICLDLDTEDLDIISQIDHLLPTSPVERIGKKGWCRFFKYNQELSQEIYSEYLDPIDNKVKKKIVLELLSHGKKVTIPPSIHPAGMEYKWTNNSLLDIDKNLLPSLPSNLLNVIAEKLKLKQTSYAAVIKISSGRTSSLVSQTSELIRHQIDVESAISKLIEFDKNNHTIPLFSDKEEFKTGIPLINAGKFYFTNLESITLKREKEGLLPELPNKLLITLKEESQNVIESKEVFELPQPTGLLKNIVNYILEKSYVEQPMFALSGAIILLGTLMGRKVTFQNATPNLYILNVANSGCVDAETEFLSTNGWMKISNWNENEKVLQYDINTGLCSFIAPINYIKQPCNEMLHFKTKYGVNQVLSLEHKVLYEDTGKNLTIKSAKEIYDLHLTNKRGFTGRFRTTFSKIDDQSINLTNDELRVQIAFLADGCLKCNGPAVKLTVKKEYKKNRIIKLLNKAKISYKRSDYTNGYSRFYFNPPLLTRKFSDIGTPFDFSIEQLKIILEECILWDGNRKNTYRTSHNIEADFIQLAAHLLGKRATIKCDNRDKHGICYQVTICENNTVGMSIDNPVKKEAHISKIKPIDGFKYCFEVPSGFFIIRRGQHIVITGNSGKDSIQQALKILLKAAKQQHLVGAASYPSEASIMAFLSQQPTRLDIIDEASSFLKSASNGGAAYQTGIGDLICELYSCANDAFLGKILGAEGGKRVGACSRPHLNILCSTTFRGVSEGISQSTLEKGLFARFLTFFGEDNKPAKRIKHSVFIPNEVSNMLEYWGAWQNPKATGNLTENYPAYEIGIDNDADELIDKYHRILDDLKTSDKNSDLMKPIASRLFQQMLKIILINSISSTKMHYVPKVSINDVEFGYRFIRYFYANIQEFIENTLHDNERMKNVNKILLLIKKSGKKGITNIDLLKQSKGIKPHERLEIIKDLYETQMITKTEKIKDNTVIHTFNFIGE